MTPEQALAIFCAECKHRHLSEGAVAAYRSLLRRFADWCAAQQLADLREATLETLLAFHRAMRRHKRPDGRLCSVRYQHRHVRTVKQLFRLLAERNLILSDIGRDFPPLCDPRGPPRGILNKDQVLDLLRQPLMTTPLGFRDRTMLEVLYSAGLRGGELCRLTLYDLDRPARALRVLQGKGRKDRVVPLGKIAAGYLGEYLKSVRPILLGPRTSPLLFVSARGLPLRPTDLGRLVKLYRAQAHLPDTITPHSMRHTCATELLKGGASIRHVQELLGHADIATTQIYTHVAPLDLKKAHARAAPSERRKSVEPAIFAAGDGSPRWTDPRNAPYWRAFRQGRGRSADDGRG